MTDVKLSQQYCCTNNTVVRLHNWSDTKHVVGTINPIPNLHVLTSRYSAGLGQDDRRSRVRFPAGVGNFSLHHRVQNGSGAHPASYTMGSRGSFPGNKAAGASSWPLTSIQCQGQRMSGAIPPLPNTPSWRGVPLQKKKAQGQLYLYNHTVGLHRRIPVW
jgi:hypothetical protein